MMHEDLFLAIGAVEDSRLARSELTVSSDNEQEERTMKRKPIRYVRNLLIAAVIVSMLAVTAYAVTGFLIFDSPEKMVSAIFGDHTGFDHNEGSIKPDPLGSPEAILVEPTFDRVPADETVVAQDIAPYIDIVGRSVSFNGFTLTVDAFMYDSGTRCGFVTYLLENPDGLPEYKLQSNGEIWYDGVPDMVDINQYGYPYIIQEKTTTTCLAATYYFKWDARRGDTLEIGLRSQTERYTPAEFEALIAEDVEKRKQEMTPEEVIEAVRQLAGEETFELLFQGMTDAQITDQCYTQLVAHETAERLEAESRSEIISVPLNQQQKLENVTAGEGSVVICPFAMRIDITDLEFLHTNARGEYRVHCDNIDSIVIQFKDGTQYIVSDGYIINYNFSVQELPEENVQTEVIVPPEDDPNGEGFAYVENSHDYCLNTISFNRIIDLDEVAAVVINGTELPVD